MSLSPGFTSAQIRGFVFEYQRQRYGTKKDWLARQPFSKAQFMRWQKAVFNGDLERGLVPRDAGGMSPRRKRELVELSADQLRAHHEAEVAMLNERIRQLEGTNDALGKAIGLLHVLREEEPDETPETSDQNDS
ncbi:MAG: hypothetical protein ACTH07_10225 [Microbacterium sp.]